MTTFPRPALAFAAAALAAALPVAATAAPFDFNVTLNTSALAAAPDGPFYLDFQLNEGSGTVPNTVSLSDFSFLGGTPSGGAATFGNASGDLGSSVLLSDDPSNPFAEFTEGFSSATSSISFNVDVSQNAAGAIPDLFAVAILDSSTPFLPEIPTTAPDTLSLIELNLGPANTSANVGVFQGVSPQVGTHIPDAARSALLLAGALAVLVGYRRLTAPARAS